VETETRTIGPPIVGPTLRQQSLAARASSAGRPREDEWATVAQLGVGGEPAEVELEASLSRPPRHDWATLGGSKAAGIG